MYSFETTAPVTAVLQIPGGRVQVIAADRADATVEVRPTDAAKSRDIKAAEQTTVVFHDGVLRIEAAPGSKILGSSGSLEITLQLPAGSHIQAKAAAAEFRGAGRLGEVAFDGAYGPVKIDEAAGVELKAHIGDITIGRLTGPAHITTGKGDIRITEARGGALTLRTQAGEVNVGA